MEPPNNSVSTGSVPVEKPKLLDQVRNRCRLKHMALSTEKQYVNWIRRYILFHHKRHPLEMGKEEVGAFLTHLAVEGHVVSCFPVPNLRSTRAAALGGAIISIRRICKTLWAVSYGSCKSKSSLAATLFVIPSPPIYWPTALISAQCKS